MSLPTIINQHSTSGFYKAPVSKVMLGSLGASHILLNTSLFSNLQKYMICKLPDSLNKGEWWRIFTSKIAYLETKDAIFCLILVYYFRIFERRLGSRKFASHLIAMTTLSGILEWVITSALVTFSPKVTSGILTVGPFGAVFPWFVFYYADVPPLTSTSFLGFRMSSKFITFLLGFQIIAGSVPNTIVAFSALVAGWLVRSNFMWVQNFLAVPKIVANSTQTILGWLVDSSAPEQGAIGATLEIQRSQQMEALEQHFIQQQARMNVRRPPNQPFRPRAQPAQPAPEPTEANITLLIDMGFPRQQAIDALREAHNDLQTATAILLRNT